MLVFPYAPEAVMCRIAVFASSLLLLPLLGCATDEVKPDDMSAQGHRAEADRERAAALEQNRIERSSSTPGREADPLTRRGDVPGVDDLFWGSSTYDPGVSSAKTPSAHSKRAQQHESAARELEKFEEAECQSFPHETRTACPLLGTVASTEDIPSGIRLHIAKGQPIDAVTAHVKCHFAFGRTRGYEGMDACPLYIKGVRVVSGADAIDLVSDDATRVDELRARARTHSSAHSE